LDDFSEMTDPRLFISVCDSGWRAALGDIDALLAYEQLKQKAPFGFGEIVFSSKALTKRLLELHISHHEVNRSGEGRWHNFNFICWSTVRAFFRAHAILLAFGKGTMGRMLARATSDPQFGLWHRLLAPVLSSAGRLGVLRWLAPLSLYLQPYLHFALKCRGAI
jgi:hypothetical protein